MHIDSIQLLRVPLAALAAQHPSEVALESVFVAISSGPTRGYGEVTLPQGPLGCAEWSSGAMACLRDWLAPALVGRAINSGEDLQQALDHFQGNAYARSALDMAWWNLAAMQHQQPLYQQLGGHTTSLPLASRLGVMDSIESLISQVGQSFERGAELVTLEFRPGWGLEMVRAVRQTFPAEPIAIDCDALCTLGQQEMFFRLEDFFLQFIEQPLSADELVGHAMLQESLRTPICLDQSVTSLARVEQILDIGGCRLVRIDPSRVGGLTPALAIRAACQDAQVPTALACGRRGLVAAYSSAALGTLPNFSSPIPWHDLARGPWLDNDAAGGAPLDTAGKFELLLPDDVAAAGLAIRHEVLEELALERATVI